MNENNCYITIVIPRPVVGLHHSAIGSFDNYFVCETLNLNFGTSFINNVVMGVESNPALFLFIIVSSTTSAGPNKFL